MHKFNITAERLLKYLSLISILFYLGGIGYNLFFYKAFNINIVEYIDLSESLLLFIPFLIPIFGFSFFLTPMLFFINRFTVNKIMKSPEPKGKSSFTLDVIFTIFGYGLIFLIIFLFRSFLESFYDFYISIVPLLLIFNLTILARSHFKESLSFLPNFVFYIFLFLMAFAIYLFIDCRNRISNVKKNKNEIEVIVTLNDSTRIRTDSTILYVGQTKNYLFTYNKSNKSTLVTPKIKIANIEFVGVKKNAQ